MSTWIGLIDGNNFFVSCERLFRPDLAKRPVVVLSSNDGCIVARSPEVKALGIPMGVPYFQVKTQLEAVETVAFSSQFTLYRDISRRVFSVVRAQVACMEQYSVDEAFFTYRGANPEQFCRQLKARVERQVGVPVSIGLAASKTQAKYANAEAKRGDGVSILTAADFATQAKATPLRELWGVGPGRARAFATHGLQTVGDLLRAEPRWIQRSFGVEGARLQAELSGQVTYPLRSQRPLQQSVMSSRTFACASSDQVVVADAVAYHIRRAVADIRAAGQVAGGLQVAIRPSRHGDFALRGGRASATLPVPSADTSDFLRLASQLLEQLWQPAVPYQKAGVMLFDLQATTGVTADLFATTKARARTALWQTVDTLNARFGTDTVRVGSVGRESTWQAKRARLSPRYTTNWAELPMVRTKTKSEQKDACI